MRGPQYWLVIIVALFLLDNALQASGLLCFECKNAGSNAHCRRIGGITRCLPNQDACMTEIRRQRRGFRAFRITKTCKQSLACDNNYWQNVGGVKNKPQRTGRQCAGRLGLPFMSTTCRCCCSENLCNSGLYNACNGAPARAREEVLPEPRCSPLEESPKFGKRKCSHSNKPGSHCVFSCKNNYIMHGEHEISCQKNNAVTASWTSLPACCAKPCPPYGGVDLLFAIQSNVPIEADWQRLKQFLMSTIQSFVQVPDGDSRIGFFTFSDKPDKSSEVFLSDRMTKMSDLHRHIYSLQRTKFPGSMNEQLRYADLERALIHSQKYSLTKKSGDRPTARDVMVIMTYGDCNANQSSVSIPARQLRDDGVQILVTNMQPKGKNIGKRYMEQLMQVSGSRSKIFTIQNSFVNKPVRRLVNPIQAGICGRPCERYNPLRNEDHNRRS